MYERAQRINEQLSSLQIDLEDRNLYYDLSSRLEENEISDEQISSLLRDVYTQSKVSGFSENNSPEEMTRMLDAMSVLTYALVANGKRELAEIALRESNEEVKRVVKSMRRSYIAASAFSRAVKSLMFYELAEAAARFFSSHTQPSLDTPEVSSIRADISQLEDQIADLDPQIDGLTDRIQDLEDKLAGTQQVTEFDFDASALTKLDDSILPNWLDGHEVYIDTNITQVSQFGPSQGDPIGAILEELPGGKTRSVGIFRYNYAGTNAGGEIIYDFFPESFLTEGTTPGGVLETFMKTYPVGGSPENLTDTTPIKVIFGPDGKIIEQILGFTATGDEVQIVGEIKLPDYLTTVKTFTEQTGLSDIANQLMALHEKLNALLDSKVYLQEEIINLQRRLIEIFSKFTGDNKWKVIGDALMALAFPTFSLLDFFAGLSNGIVWFGSEYRSESSGKKDQQAPGPGVPPSGDEGGQQAPGPGLPPSPVAGLLSSGKEDKQAKVAGLLSSGKEDKQAKVAGLLPSGEESKQATPGPALPSSGDEGNTNSSDIAGDTPEELAEDYKYYQMSVNGRDPNTGRYFPKEERIKAFKERRKKEDQRNSAKRKKTSPDFFRDRSANTTEL